jgi:hypothetical protein
VLALGRVNSTVVRLLRTFIAFLLVAGSIACGFFTGPRDIKLENPVQAVIDARKLIAEERQEPSEPIRKPEELPESLRIPGLRWAIIHDDHIDLVMYHHPDGEKGARIWSLDTKREHRDQPTRYPEVYFFFYDNDSPQSPENIP